MPEGPERELLVLRHAKSGWDADVGSDFERSLAPRGRRDAPRIGDWLARRGLLPDYVVCSPAVRAAETATLVLNAMGLEGQPSRWDKRIYDAGAQELIELLAEVPADSKRALLIGHNPGLEGLVRSLAKSSSGFERGKFFPTCALAQLRMPADWRDLSNGCAELLDLARPKEI
jgi:phosphohistidine phosphatase